MADKTKIEWTDATWNPITGCSVVSPGCTNCYAMRLAGTRLKHHPSRAGLTRVTKAGPVWTGEVRFNPQWLDQPRHWTKPRMIFVCAHGDLFAEGVEDAWLDQIFAVMALSPQHTFQVLTKRPERMREYILTARRKLGRQTEIRRAIVDIAGGREAQGVTAAFLRVSGAEEDWKPLPNVWLGVSCEDQRRADERVPILLDTPAAIRWVSAEPLLGQIDFSRLDQPNGGFGPYWINALRAGEMGWFSDEAATIRTDPDPLAFADHPRLDWIVAGGESGTNARRMHADWARKIRDDCAAAGVPFLFKQWGAYLPAGQNTADGRPWAPLCGSWLHAAKGLAGRFLDGVEHNGFPQQQG